MFLEEKGQKMENNIKKEKKGNKKLKITLKNAKELLDFDYKDLKLKPREIRFVAAFCATWDQKKSYLMAGYKATTENSLYANSTRLISNDKISTAIQRYVSKAIEPYKDRLNLMLLEVWYRRAFYDVSIFYNSDGTIKDLDEIPEEWRICIDRINIRHYGKESTNSETVWSLCSRTEALKEIRSVLELAIGKSVNGDNSAEIKEKLELLKQKKYSELGINENDGIIPFKKLRKAE